MAQVSVTRSIDGETIYIPDTCVVEPFSDENGSASRVSVGNRVLFVLETPDDIAAAIAGAVPGAAAPVAVAKNTKGGQLQAGEQTLNTSKSVIE